MASPLSQGLSILQQGAEDFAKSQEERQKAEAQSAGNRQIFNQLVNSGIWGNQEVIDFNKGNAKQRNDMIAAGVRAQLFKSQQEDQQMQREAGQRAATELQLHKDTIARHAWEYDQAAKAKADEAAAAAAYVKQGPVTAPVPGTAEPGAEGPGGIPMRAILSRTGDWNMISEIPMSQAAKYARDIQDKAKALSESKIEITHPLTGKRVYVDPNSEIAKQATYAAHPEIDLKQKYNLRPQDMFNKDIHKAGTLSGKDFTPDPNGPYTAVAGKAMPTSEFQEFQQRLMTAGMGPKPSQAPESTGTAGGGGFWSHVLGPFAGGGYGGGGAPAPTATPGTQGGSMKLTPDIAQGFADQASRQGLTGPAAIKAAKQMAADAGYTE